MGIKDEVIPTMAWNTHQSCFSGNAPYSGHKLPSTFSNGCQCLSLTKCWRSGPSAQGEELGTCYQPLERNPIQPYGCLGFPKTTSKSHISTGTMAYLCKLSTPLRKTEHLNADGNCVRAKRSIVELDDLNTLNNCTTSCPMIAEHCTYKQQLQHRGCTVNPDECRSLRDVRSDMAHSRKVKEDPTNCQLNTSMTRSKLCSQVCQSPVDSSRSLCPLPAQRCRPNISRCASTCEPHCTGLPLDIGDTARKRLEQRKICQTYPTRRPRLPYTRKTTKNMPLKPCGVSCMTFYKASLEHYHRPSFACAERCSNACHLAHVCCPHRRVSRSCSRHGCPGVCPCHLFV